MKQREFALLVKNGVDLTLYFVPWGGGYAALYRYPTNTVRHTIVKQKGGDKYFGALKTAEKWAKQMGCKSFIVELPQ